MVRTNNPFVGRQHATLRDAGDRWILEEKGGHAIYLNGSRVPRVEITGAVTVWLAKPGKGDELDLRPISASIPGQSLPVGQTPVPPSGPPPASPSQKPLSALRAAARVRIGRASDNDLVIADDLRVSRHHAELLKDKHGVWGVADAGSRNGVFVNGKRVERQRLADGDLVAIGNHTFRFEREALREWRRPSGSALEAAGLVVQIGRTKILDGITFRLEPGTLLAIIGPSGSGKTTLLNALLGVRPADQGAVTFGGRDLYASIEDLRRKIGFVPQDDILHTQLTVRKALEFAAELRFPGDIDPKKRSDRIKEVMKDLDLKGGDRRISTLSGGQRKRVSTALELLTEPELLFLDEPTSGLDPGNERNVMGLLRDLADGGRTVVVTTHTTGSLKLCDRILFIAPRGRMAFFGTPDEALVYFAGHRIGMDYPEIFNRISEDTRTDWPALLRSDPAYAKYVARKAPVASVSAGVVAPRPKREQTWVHQFSVLARRYVAVIAADRRAMFWLSVQAPLFGLLFSLLTGTGRVTVRHGLEAAFLVWFIIVGATWLGTSNAIKEIVKEGPIYERERAVGLSAQAYLASKAVILGMITIVQCVVMVAFAMWGQHLGDPARQDVSRLVPPLRQAYPDIFAGQSRFASGSLIHWQWGEFALVAILAGLAAMALGLFVSAVVKSPDLALILLPMLLVGQVVLSVPLEIVGKGSRVVEVAGWISSADWAKDAASSTIELNTLHLTEGLARELGEHDLKVALHQIHKGPYEPPLTEGRVEQTIRELLNGQKRWRHAPGTWVRSMAVVLAMTVLLLGATLGVLRYDARLRRRGLR